MSDERFEHDDNFNKVSLRAERFDDEITVATRYHGTWQQVYMSPEQARELAHFLINRANEIEAEKVAGLIEGE
jgi:hypothetical protein